MKQIKENRCCIQLGIKDENQGGMKDASLGQAWVAEWRMVLPVQAPRRKQRVSEVKAGGRWEEKGEFGLGGGGLRLALSWPTGSLSLTSHCPF